MWKNQIGRSRLVASGSKLRAGAHRRHRDAPWRAPAVSNEPVAASPEGPRPLPYPLPSAKLTGLHFSHIWTEFGARHGQAHISSPQQAPHQNARVSRAHGNQMGT